MEITLELGLELPNPQNYIRLKKASDFSGASCIPVETLTDEQAKRYAEELRQDFIRHYKELKTGK